MMWQKPARWLYYLVRVTVIAPVLVVARLFGVSQNDLIKWTMLRAMGAHKSGSDSLHARLGALCKRIVAESKAAEPSSLRNIVAVW